MKQTITTHAVTIICLIKSTTCFFLLPFLVEGFLVFFFAIVHPFFKTKCKYKDYFVFLRPKQYLDEHIHT